MSGPDLPLISDRAVQSSVGASSYVRGREYYRVGRVKRLEWNPDELKLEGAVRGSRRQPYTTTVWLSEDPRGSSVRASACSCPLGRDCKHVAASLLSFQAQARRSTAADATASRPPRPSPPPQPAWKSALGPLIRSGAAGSAGVPAGDYVRLGLQLRVDGLKQALESSPSALSGSTLRVQIRPVQQGSKGGWSGGYGVGWTPARFGRTTFDPRVTGWLEELGSLWRGTGSAYGYGYGSPEWRNLDDFAPAAVWEQLNRAAELEVPLLGNAAGDTVELAARADLALEVSATTDGELGLRRRLAFDDVPAAVDVAGTAGAAGLFGVQLPGTARRLLIGPTARRLTDAERTLLAFPGAHVPQTDAAEFLEATVPRLRRQVPLRCFDGSVTLPEPPVPRLLLSVAAPNPSVLRLSWQWLYGTARRALHAVDDLRDPTAELLVRRRVEAAVGDSLAFTEHAEFTGSAAVDFARTVLPLLRACDDVVVEADDLPDYREIEGTPLVTVAAEEGVDPDWFDLGIRVSVEDREVPFAPLFEALARGQDYLLLDDGSYLRTDLPVLHQLRTLIEEARRLQDRPGPLRLNRYAAGLWGDLAELADVVEQSDRWRESVGALAALSSGNAVPGPVPVPDGLTAELRPYQKQAYDWLVFLHRHGLGGILADDMGLGKTVEVLALLEHARSAAAAGQASQRRPFLVVAPASVTANWGSESRRFTPELRTLVLPSTLGRLGVPIEEVVAEVDVVVTSYAIFRLDFDQLSSVEWAGLILDEAQFLKNPKTRANECARLLRAPLKLAVTGTPMENNLTELWAMLAVVAPGLYGSATRFREDYVVRVGNGLRARQALAHADSGRLVGYDDESRATDLAAAEAGDAALARLRRRIRPLLLRRTKSRLLPTCPTESSRSSGLSWPRGTVARTTCCSSASVSGCCGCWGRTSTETASRSSGR